MKKNKRRKRRSINCKNNSEEQKNLRVDEKEREQTGK
jgi:hypothetical protein